MLLMGATALAVAGAILGSSFFSGRGTKIEPVTRAHIRWVRPGTGGQRQALADYFDPSLMSLPSPLGFSRGPWAELARPTASPYEPIIPSAFLAPLAGQEPPTLLPQTPLRDVVQAGLERPAFDVADELPRPAVGRPATNSVFQVEGVLAHRRMLQAPVVPLAPAMITVRRTGVRLAVGADGRVRHAVLDRSCGNEALDTEAVELTRQLRFEPQASADALAVTWGTVRFIWANAPGN